MVQIESDTIKLLRECDAGIHMGIDSIGDVMDRVEAPHLQELLLQCKAEHEALQTHVQKLLLTYHDDGKSLSPMAKGMSWIKTNMKLTLDHSDATIAELMVDGCNMGVKSLSRYLNEYKAADEESKDIAKKLIAIESKLSESLRDYL